MRKSLKNRAVIPRTLKSKKLSQMESHLDSLGYDTSNVAARARSQSRGRSMVRGRSEGFDPDAMELDDPKAALQRAKSRARSQSTNRRTDGVTNEAARSNAERLAKLGQKKMNRMARQGEADRHQTGSLTKHLVSRPKQLFMSLILMFHVDCGQARHWQDEQAISDMLLLSGFRTATGVWSFKRCHTEGMRDNAWRARFDLIPYLHFLPTTDHSMGHFKSVLVGTSSHRAYDRRSGRNFIQTVQIAVLILVVYILRVQQTFAHFLAASGSFRDCS